MMMKKTLLVAAAALFASVTFAQEGIITNKKGTPILPQAGDYAIGVDATPFLEYFGNMFNGENFNAAQVFNTIRIDRLVFMPSNLYLLQKLTD